MKVAVFGAEDFPFGKKSFYDERLDDLQEIFHSKKTTPLQIEFVPFKELKDAEALVGPAAKKDDLILADLEYVYDRLDKELPPQEKELFEKLKTLLEKEQFLFSALSAEERKLLRGFPLVTVLPVGLFSDPADCGSHEFLEPLYHSAGRSFFFTGGEPESRMWPIRQGDTAWHAAGVIHSDIQQGFIRAEVVAIGDLLAAGHYNQARNEGKIRLEPKEYVVQEGDVMLFRFNK